MGVSEAADRADTFVAHKFDEKTVDLGEIRMNYVAEGDPEAPALLLIPAQGESWWGYEEAIALLSPEFRVFAIDLRGQGRTTWTPGRYNLNTWGSDVEHFIDLVIGRPALVAGNSSGGVITAWLSAYAKPGLVRGVILEDPPLFSSQAAPPYGPGMMQTLGPIFALWAKWLGPQWSIGDWEGMIEAAPAELPEFLHPGIGFMMGDGNGKASPTRSSTSRNTTLNGARHGPPTPPTPVATTPPCCRRTRPRHCSPTTSTKPTPRPANSWAR